VNRGNRVRYGMPADGSHRAHFIQELGLEHWTDGGASHGRAAIVPEMLVPGTGVVRIGVLTVLADVVAGQPPSGPVSPTTDISVHVAHVRPMKSVSLVSRVLKAGRSLLVAETLLTADEEPEPFATSLVTFMNRSIDVGGGAPPSGQRLGEPVGERIGARVLHPGTVELAPQADLRNEHHGTVQGGVMALLAELAAESALGEAGPVVATDLDIRFLNRVKVGPARATARTLIADPRGWVLGVAIRDAGDADRMAAYTSIRCSPAPPLDV